MGGSHSAERPRRVAVLGGGPAGLTAAYRLVKTSSPIHVDVYEASGRFGGAIQSETDGRFTYDLGPNSMNLKHAAVAHLVLAQLRLADLVERRVAPRRILVLRDGALHPVPQSPGQFLRTPLLSARAKLRVLREPFARRLADQAADTESVADFTRRRLGQEALDYLVDPAMAGIYSAPPARLSLKHAFPKLYDMERAAGSLFLGAFAAARARKKRERADGGPALGFSRKQLSESLSFRGGMQTLPNALETALRGYTTRDARARLRRHARVRSLERDTRDGTWSVNGRRGYDAVVSTLPAYALGDVWSNVRAVRRGFARLARTVRYAPVAVAVLGFERDAVPDSVYGFGALYPGCEKRRILGVNFSSAGFPQRLRAADGATGADGADRTYLTVYLGGLRNPDIALQDAAQIVETATTELRATLGVSGKPVAAHVKNWPRGIPVYHPGYDGAVCAMARVEKRAPGLVLAGNYRGGVGVPDALLSGMVAADRVRVTLERRAEADAGKAGKPRLPRWARKDAKKKGETKKRKSKSEAAGKRVEAVGAGK